MQDTNDKKPETIRSLLELIRTLRVQCPWDRKQTPETLIVYLLEESYELLDAVTSGDPDHIREEMGDVLFQILFLIFLFEEKGAFSLSDVIQKNIEKMIRRHPHVFGEVTAETPEKVSENWDAIKSLEKSDTSKSLIDSVPAGIPPVHRSYMISEKVGRAGFDWDDIHGVTEKVEEEWAELKDAISDGVREDISLEFGDLLFTLTNVARFAGIHPDTALAGSVNKFESRFRYMENLLLKTGKTLSDLTADEKDHLWNRAKKDTK